MQFDKKISLGNILTLLGMFVSVFFAYFELKFELKAADVGIKAMVLQKETEVLGKVEAAKVNFNGKISNIESKVEYVETDTKRRLSKIESKIDQLLDYQMKSAPPKK